MSRREEEFVNPFISAPYPNMIRVGFGREEYVHCEILSSGEIQFVGDPWDDPVLTLKPRDWEKVQFFANHLRHYFENPEEAEPDEAPRDPAPPDEEEESGLVVKIKGSAVAGQAKQLALK
jgi:hypothetical protein